MTKPSYDIIVRVRHMTSAAIGCVVAERIEHVTFTPCELKNLLGEIDAILEKYLVVAKVPGNVRPVSDSKGNQSPASPARSRKRSSS
jgi:hypothetical protein